MTKSELIENLSTKHPTLSAKEVEGIVKDILELIAQSLEEGNRIEVRGFGSFSLHHRQPRVGRNPKTGDSVKLDAKSVPHFKAGKELKDRVNVFCLNIQSNINKTTLKVSFFITNFGIMNLFLTKEIVMIKYILGLIIVLAIVLVAVTIGANNDQVITFNYIVAESQFQLSTLVAILFGFGLILGWLNYRIFLLKN